MLTNCCINVVTRSSLNLLDRYLFGKQNLSFFHLYFCSISLPFIYGLCAIPFTGQIEEAISYFLSINCFLLALATNLVGLSFSYAFRQKEVHHVILHSKIPELLFPLLLFLPLFSIGSSSFYEPTWKSFLPLTVTWISFIPYFLRGKSLGSFFDKTAFFIIGSLLFQMVVSANILVSKTNFHQILSYTVALLLWRCILSIPISLTNKKKETYRGAAEILNLDDLKAPGFPHRKWVNISNMNPFAMREPRGLSEWSKSKFQLLLGISNPTPLSGKLSGLIAFRGVIALITQFTFTWAIIEGDPLIVWPILNTTVFVSSIASQFILKEKIHRSDWIALCGVFVSSCLTQIK